jgi:transcription initiation factor TFIID subunit TAF12
MNQQNPNIPNGQQQQPQQQQQQQQQQQPQQQNPLNLNLQNEVPNANWREELNVQDRARFVSQL